MQFVATALSGWLAAFLLAAGIGVPYFVRANPMAEPGYVKRMRPHFWIGFAVPAIVLGHAWLPMSAGHMRGYDLAGLWLATAAFFVMLAQASLGVILRNASPVGRRTIKRLHFWTMAVIALLVPAHILLNRA
jgi:thiosulfate reductase cytochrome b subunit